MGFLSEMLRGRAPAETRSSDLSSLLTAMGWGQKSASGVNVTTERALRMSAVAACVRVVSEDVAALPWHLYRRLAPRGKERASDHPLYSLLHDLPNPEMTAFELEENLVGHLLCWGWAYCEIEYDGAGRRKALWPLRPDRVARVAPTEPGGASSYEITLPDQSKIRLPRWRIWAIRGWSLEAFAAGGLIEQGKDAIGLGIAAEEYGARFFGNDSRPGGVLEHPAKLSEAAALRMKQSWDEAHSGLSNSHRVAILEEGVKWQAIGISPENAQFLETRKFQRSEIAGLFRVPPHKIGDLEKATFSNIEQQSIDYVNDTITPVCVRLDQTVYRDLLTPAERKTYFAEHFLAGRMRGELLPRYQAYAIGVQNSWLCADDVREAENMNPLPDGQGQVFRAPLNTAPVDQVGQQQEPASSQNGNAEPPDSQDGNDERQAVALEARRARRLEQRSVATGRKRLAGSFRPAISAVSQRVVNREVNDLQNAAKKGRTHLLKWLPDWLEQHTDVVREYLGPTMRTYADQVIADVERELGQDAPAGVTNFTEGYIRRRAEIWVENLRRGLGKIDEDAADDEAWGELVDGWLTKRKAERADDWAREESVRTLGAVARIAYELMGVAALMWMAVGETCPYCQDFDGQTIEIKAQFLPAGTTLAPEGAEPFTSDTDVGHPPLHDGCDCVVVAA